MFMFTRESRFITVQNQRENQETGDKPVDQEYFGSTRKSVSCKTTLM